ncbi:MAG: DUF167 domain-containing protein [Promethearchaeota archaeon]
MLFLTKKSEKSYILKINVKPNAKRQMISDDGNYLTISVRSKPIQNKANKELISLFKKRFEISSNQIKIISGIKSSNKIIQIDFFHDIEKKEIIRRLLN